MTRSMSLVTAFALAAFMTAPAALAQTAPDPHHPTDDAAPEATQPPTQSAPQGMMGMMDMMRMMQMMHQGGMMTPGMMAPGAGMPGQETVGMPRADHIEGRIAFLRAELRITAAQDVAWQRFADALRAGAKRLSEVQDGVGEAANEADLVAALARQEMMLAARLDAVRALKSALASLQDALSPEQRTRLAQLATSPMGPMHGGMMARKGAMPMGAQTP